MWIGAIRLRVRTKDTPNAGTDDQVEVRLMRDFDVIRTFNLNYPSENDLEQGAVRNYDYTGLARDNHKTPALPPGVAQNPMPYPSYGIEFSDGVRGHLRLQLRIRGDDQWIKDNIKLYIREIRQISTSFDTLEWREDASWTYLDDWRDDLAMSTDFTEGYSTYVLFLL
jgi:hypothetical protein